MPVHTPNTPPPAVLLLKVTPNASRSEIAGLHDGRIRIRIAAPPEDGRANLALCALLATALGVRRRDVVVSSGATSPLKTVTVTGLTTAQAHERLGLGSQS